MRINISDMFNQRRIIDITKDVIVHPLKYKKVETIVPGPSTIQLEFTFPNNSTIQITPSGDNVVDKKQ